VAIVWHDVFKSEAEIKFMEGYIRKGQKYSFLVDGRIVINI
jgi:hypothetical protein